MGCLCCVGASISPARFVLRMGISPLVRPAPQRYRKPTPLVRWTPVLARSPLTGTVTELPRPRNTITGSRDARFRVTAVFLTAVFHMIGVNYPPVPICCPRALHCTLHGHTAPDRVRITEPRGRGRAVHRRPWARRAAHPSLGRHRATLRNVFYEKNEQYLKKYFLKSKHDLKHGPHRTFHEKSKSSGLGNQ